MAADAIQDDDGPRHLKQVSRIKHIILQKYLPSWERILGSRNPRLCYFDCYAGPGVYEFEGQKVDDSPMIAVRAAQEFLAKAKGHQMTVIPVEKDERQRASVDAELKGVQPYGQGLQVHVMAEDVKEFVPKLLGQVPKLAPSFFMVDPYGHPLTVPILFTDPGLRALVCSDWRLPSEPPRALFCRAGAERRRCAASGGGKWLAESGS